MPASHRVSKLWSMRRMSTMMSFKCGWLQEADTHNKLLEDTANAAGPDFDGNLFADSMVKVQMASGQLNEDTSPMMVGVST